MVVVNAMRALPFNGAETFGQVFNSILESIKVDGIFSANLYGIRDNRNSRDSDIAFHTKEEVMSLLEDMEIIDFREEERTDENSKHWHIFYFIARKILSLLIRLLQKKSYGI